MPLHDFRCERGHIFEEFQSLLELRDETRCYCGATAKKIFIAAPFTRGDTPDYESPITGLPIRGRAQRREDLARSGCVEWEPGMREENARRRAARDRAEEQAIDQTLDAEISRMPARKLELLEQELRAGVSATVERATPKGV